MMSLDSRSHARLLWVGALLAPAIAVQAVRFVADAEIAPASAGVPAAAIPPIVLKPAEPPITARQKQALDWLSSRSNQLATRSPMFVPPSPEEEHSHAHAKSDPDHGPPAAQAAPPTVVDDRPTHLKLSGMVGSDKEALAAISGKLRRVGDELAPGWVVERIDSRHRVVVLKHTDGRTFQISPPTPSLER
jgi:hypothetical protein